ncbi:hypothetical protein AAZV13_03G091700 [Glycine max]
MASRGEAVVWGGKQQKKKKGIAVGRNRKILGDIGNLVNRPITRSFSAQILAKVQAAAKNNKKQASVKVKPKAEEVIDIEAGPDKEVQKNKNKESRASTSVLTARSNAACDITNKPREQIIDIDASDSDNELAAVEYIDDICKFYKLVEVDELVRLTDYTHEQVLVMEKTILNKLEWNLTVPTTFVFLVRFIKASVPDQELENMAHFLSELGMMHYATLKYFPSMVAASAVFAARCTLNKAPLWTETLKLHTGYSQGQLMDCARLLVSFHSMAGNGEEKVVYIKYSDPEKGAVAMLPPAKNLMPEGSDSQ